MRSKNDHIDRKCQAKMKKMKLTKKNKKELKMISAVLILLMLVFVWIVQNIGLPIKTQIEKGKIKVIDISSYNGTVNWKKVKDHNINHAMIKIGSGINKNRQGRKDAKFDTNFRNADMQQFIEAFIIILMQRRWMMPKKKLRIV